jgi:hypothetical protein
LAGHHHSDDAKEQLAPARRNGDAACLTNLPSAYGTQGFILEHADLDQSIGLGNLGNMFNSHLSAAAVRT